ncbi:MULTISPECIES: hypothetical protein [unclassified Roseovarius]|uniref:hypothetical protein n=1 Tax=unclassified Roseovarius TaxID=2614913 RepID=UPI00273D6989|nr:MULTISPECIES: hypothetical protein [unclassified Roseovarius]
MFIRLIPIGGDPAKDTIEDLEMSTVPQVGDVIEVEYEPREFTTYEVTKRRFRVDPKIEGESAYSQRVAVEVTEIGPVSHTTTELRL